MSQETGEDQLIHLNQLLMSQDEASQQNQNYEYQSPSTMTVADVYPEESFTVKTFKAHPEWFGESGIALLYALHGAQQNPSESYYMMFDTFIRNRNQQIISDALLGKKYSYLNDPNSIITWARIMMETQKAPIFEPIMLQLNNVFKDWFATKRVTYEGIQYDLSDFEAIAYTWSGENIISLLPYICYLMTFYIDCRPYTFTEALSLSSYQMFRTQFNKYLKKNYETLISQNGGNYAIDGFNNFESLPVESIKTFYQYVLSPSSVSKLITDVLSAQPSLMEQVIRDQNAINDYNYVKERFDNVLSNLLTNIIDASPIKNILTELPSFDPRRLNERELMYLTEYAYTGGDKSFCIETMSESNEVNYPYSAYASKDPPATYPTEIVSTQQLKTKINKLGMCYGMPFSSSDLLNNMFRAYLYTDFQTERDNNMIGTGSAFMIDESYLRKENPFGNNCKGNFSTILKNLFVNGVWMFDNSSMSHLLPELLSKDTFKNAIKNILSLCSVTQICYNNRLGSLLIETFIISYLNFWLLQAIQNNLDLAYFDPMRYIVQMDLTQTAIQARISKITNMIYALFYLSNESYCAFVNYKETEFTKIITMNAIIQIPYETRLENDYVQYYSIGGTETYRHSFDSNPLVRGYHILTNAYGNCEELYTFYQWISKLSNSALFEIIDQNKSMTGEIGSIIRSNMEQIYASGSYPIMLNNFMYTGLNYTFKQDLFVLDLTDNKDSLLNVFRRYAPPRAEASRTAGKKVCFQYVPLDGNKFPDEFPPAVSNGILYNNKIHDALLIDYGVSLPLPLYDVNPIIDNECYVSYNIPPGYHQYILQLFDSYSNDYVSCVLIWSKAVVGDKFTRFMSWENSNRKVKESSPADSAMSIIDRLIPKAESNGNLDN